MKKAIPFKFSHTVINNKTGEQLHVGDLEVHAVCYRFNDGSLLMDDDEKPLIDFDGIMHEGKNITLMLDAIAEETYLKLRSAAQELAKTYETFEGEISEAEKFGQEMADESERAVYQTNEHA